MPDPLDLFRRSCLGGGTDLDETIHPLDEMLSVLVARRGEVRATMEYLRSGYDLTRAVEQIARWRFGEDLRSVQVLEFASGYGRNVRHLVRRFGAANVAVSDIYAAAVTFCTGRFGVRGFASAHDPADLTCAERFDLIVVPSLFTHLPGRTFAGWLEALLDLLTPRGILVFSVHGAELRPDWDGRDGILFERESESATLDPGEYGTTHVTEAYVADRIAEAAGHRLYSRTRLGFWRHQDFYVVPRRPDPSVAGFRFDHGVIWSLDIVRRTPDGHLEVAGWATTPDGAGTPAEVRVTLDGLTVATGPARVIRDQVAALWGDATRESGFWFLIPDVTRFHDDGSELIITARMAGETACLYAGPLASALTEG